MATTSNLAQQALNNLVNQFARPMDFLRELVQNSIDAGSPRVEVWVRHTPAAADSEHRDGVLEIHVDDFGEGMDEPIIDEQLTRMFSSTKEDDLTKIGKFGIGFTSIFAIHPDAVLLHTGRHGEYWELLFHPDRSFDKIKVDKPVDGTRITLYKRMPPHEVERVVREARWILRYWCEHSNTPVTFWDRTGQREDFQVDAEDPFAAFTAEDAGETSGPEALTRALDLDADLMVSLSEDGLEALVGYARQPRYGFYNGGLTLLNTRSTDTLGEYAERLGHLSFKVKSDDLEHTLTRDNVIQDAHWHKVMRALLRAARALQERLLETLAASVEGDGQQEGDDADGGERRWLRHLARDCRADPDIRQIEGLWGRIKLRDHAGAVVTLEAIDEQAAKLGAVLLDPGPGPLRDALTAEEFILLPNAPEVRELLRAAPQDGLFVRQQRQVSSAEGLFILPQLLDADLLPHQERGLLKRCAELIAAAVGSRVEVRIGDYGGPERAAREELALDGPAEGGLFQRPDRGRLRWPLLLKRRCLLINRHHPFYQAQLIAFAEEPTLAAYGLAAALLHEDGISRSRTYRLLLEAAAQEVLPR